MLLLLAVDLLPAKLIAPIPLVDVVWKLFSGVLIGPMQAFIFALLTIVYFEAAIAGSE